MQQWRVRLWQNDSQVTPPFFISLFFLHTTIFQAVPRRIRLRYLDHHQDHHDPNSLQSRLVLRTSVRRFIHNTHPDWRQVVESPVGKRSHFSCPNRREKFPCFVLSSRGDQRRGKGTSGPYWTYEYHNLWDRSWQVCFNFSKKMEVLRSPDTDEGWRQ